MSYRSIGAEIHNKLYYRMIPRLCCSLINLYLQSHRRDLKTLYPLKYLMHST